MTGEHHDWFVAAGLTAGDGSIQRPFHDPWVALRYAEPGDRIHIAAGTYYGRNERSSWTIDCPELTLLGGYDPDFTVRTPWQTPTVFAARADSRIQHEPNMFQGTGEHGGVILDGLFFDAAGRNDYDEQGGLRSSPYGDGALVSLRGERITVRNCGFANASAGAAEIGGNGGRFENNLVVNLVGVGLTVRDSDSQAPIVVSRSTFCFVHDDSDPPRGAGADKAIGVGVHGAAAIEDNLFVGCGNAAIACYRDIDRVAVNRNLFFLTFRDAVRSRATSAEAEITEEHLEEIEDVGLQSAAGNTVGDPRLSGLPIAWVDGYTQDASTSYGHPPVAALNVLRSAAGLGTLPGTGAAIGPLMRRLSPPEVLALATETPQGWHCVELPAVEPVGTRPPAPEYHAIEWARFAQADPALQDEAVELRVGLGFDQNTELLADAGPATHIGVAVYEPGADDRPLFALAGRHSLAHRQIEEAIRYQRGLDVESTYLLRGTYRVDLTQSARQPATIVLDSIAPQLDGEAPTVVRSDGRHWFVRAGASGGDGSREAPFRDPFQALEKAEGGDHIHVAEGMYPGRLRSGAWRIPVRNLTLLGGYTEDFTSRDPWRHPVRFVMNPETRAKGIPSDPILSPDDICAGLVLDGFVFDGSTYNAYTESGSLDVANSPSSPVLDLRGDGMTVCNCIFVNAASSAVQLSGASGVFENNLVVNTSGTAVRLQTPGAGPWLVANNTILFAADPTDRASSGHSTAGTLLEVSGRAVVRIQSNVLAFADGIGARVTVPDQNLVLDDNIVAANLYADVYDGRTVLIDRAGWARALLDTPFGSLARNRLDVPTLSVDQTYAQAAINRLASLPAYLSADLLRAGAVALGVAYPTAAAPAVAVAVTPEPSKTDSVTDLLANLRRMREEVDTKDTDDPPKMTVDYCPAYPLDAALSLIQTSSDDQTGARAVNIAVSFPQEPPAQPLIEHRHVDGAAIDADPSALDGTAVEMDVTDVRSAAMNTSLYPAGTTRDTHEAFMVTAVGEPTRTRLVVVVRDDTATSKIFARLVPTDTVRVCGVGRVIQDGKAVTVIADSAERS